MESGIRAPRLHRTLLAPKSRPVNRESRQQLQTLRDALLKLHKTLVESERVGYEAAFGTIGSPTHFLKLLTGDPWFAWLHPLSQLIVKMDETLENPEPDDHAAAELLGVTRRLLVASEDGNGFARSYFDALQRDPDVVFAHAEAARHFRPAPSSPP